MIKLAHMQNAFLDIDGFSIFDYKNGSYVFFKTVDDKMVNVVVNGQYSTAVPLSFEIEENDDQRLVDVLKDFMEEVGVVPGSPIRITPGKNEKELRIHLEEDEDWNEVDESHIAHTIYKAYDEELYTLFSSLIETIAQLPLIKHDIALQDFSTYFTNRNVWFAKKYFEASQSEDCYLLSMFRELVDLEHHGGEGTVSVAGGLKQLRQDLRMLEYVIKDKEQLVQTEIKRKDDIIQSLRYPGIKK